MKAALIAALVSTLVASGGAVAAVQINGRAIRPHSIPLNRLAHQPATATRLGRVSYPFIVAAGASGVLQAPCPAGQIAISGGYQAAPGGRVLMRGSWPFLNTSGWNIAYENDSTVAVKIWAYAVCAPAVSLG